MILAQDIMNFKNRLYLIAAMILLVGLSASAFIYLTAEDVSDDMLIYEFEHSKAYRHDLELYGGKINVLASEFMHWFKGLWHGKSLAITIGLITIMVATIVLFVGYQIMPDNDTDGKKQNET